MKFPEIIGLDLGTARNILKGSNLHIQNISVTNPPKHKSGEYDDSFRIIRAVINDDEKLELLVCKPL